MKQLNVASFFSGIGGFDLAFERAGFRVNFQCEIQRFCRQVLEQHWPAVVLGHDIAAVPAPSIPDADVWCGGFPCQDLSVARGSLGRHGLNGSRSGLFFRFASLAEKKRPRVIVIENVHGLLNSNDGKDFAELLYTLERLNYAVSWRLLNSRYFGLPQSRPRVYICAWLKNPVAAGNVLFESRRPIPATNERSAFLETSWTSGAGPITPKVAFCLAATSGRHTGTDWSRTYVAYADEARRLTPTECERLQGFPDNWTELKNPSVDMEKSDSLRYHALGNAVSVKVVEWIADRIHRGLQKDSASRKHSRRKQTFFLEALEKWPGLNAPAKISGDLSAVRRSRSKLVWPNAGILWNGTFVAARTPPTLQSPIYCDLLSIIERARPDARYFLSPNAAEGILRRVDTQERHLFPPLRRALERLSGRQPTIQTIPVASRQLSLHLPDTECVSP
jgi:DNA (cytosine-5)-methyltransferase 1